MLYLIQKEPSKEEFVDAYDGKTYEWTNNRKTAWALPFNKAQGRLYLVQRAGHPLACLVTQTKSKRT